MQYQQFENDPDNICRVCINDDFNRYNGRVCKVLRELFTDVRYYNCSICGEYRVDGIAWWQLPKTNVQFIKSCWSRMNQNNVPEIIRIFFNNYYFINSDSKLPEEIKLYVLKMRSAVSHRFKMDSLIGKPNTIYGNDKLFYYFVNSRLPSHKDQLYSVIRYLGETREISGTSLANFPVDFHSIIGALNRDSAFGLVKQLMNENIINCELKSNVIEQCSGFYLTLNGIEKFEGLNKILL